MLIHSGRPLLNLLVEQSLTLTTSATNGPMRDYHQRESCLTRHDSDEPTTPFRATMSISNVEQVL